MFAHDCCSAPLRSMLRDAWRSRGGLRESKLRYGFFTEASIRESVLMWLSYLRVQPWESAAYGLQRTTHYVVALRNILFVECILNVSLLVRRLSRRAGELAAFGLWYALLLLLHEIAELWRTVNARHDAQNSQLVLQSRME